jgi:hypothetical protein
MFRQLIVAVFKEKFVGYIRENVITYEHILLYKVYLFISILTTNSHTHIFLTFQNGVTIYTACINTQLS